MRFHIGFSKRVSLKWILLILGGLLAFFGIGNLTVLALDNFQGRNISNTKWCVFGETNPQASCLSQSSTVAYNQSTNGYENSIAPTGIQNENNGRLVPDSHSIFWIYSGVNSSNSPCNNPNTVSFNVIVNPRDYNWTLANNELNPNSFGDWTPLSVSMREAIKSFSRKSYTSNSHYYKYLVNENNYGVSVGARYNNNGTITYRNETQCSFFAYGPIRQLKFRCDINMTQPSNSLYINIQYTNDSFMQCPGCYNNLRLRDEIVVEEIYDPCNPNNTGNDQQSVVDSINNQSGVISSNTSDIIENNNSNTEAIVDAIHDSSSQNHDDFNSVMNELQNDNTTSSSNTVSDWLNNMGDDDSIGDITDILTAPIRLYEAIRDTDASTCTGLSLPISFRGMNKTVTIPCGDVFWGRFDATAILLYHVIVFGAMAYAIGVYAIKSFNECLDPKDMNEITIKKL